LYATALELVGDASDYAAAAGTLPRGVIARRGRATIDADDLPEASLNSEWSGITVMASDWSQTAVRATAAWVDDTIRFELAAGRERLFDGEIISRTTCDGEAVTFVDGWEQVCWQSDEQGDYLELSIDLSHGLRLERQLLLNRADRVVYLADVVLSSDKSPRRIVHAIELPMGPEAVWQPEAETRDGVVAGIKARAALLPLALAEWRSDPRGGRLEAAPGKLVLTQETSGRALCCPVLLDLDQRRTKKECTASLPC
jgi:hypothetical protein